MALRRSIASRLLTGLVQPGSLEDSDPVLVAKLAERRVVVTSQSQFRDQPLQPGSGTKLLRHERTVEIGSERDSIDPKVIDELLEMFDQRAERRLGVIFAVRANEPDVEVDADNAVR